MPATLESCVRLANTMLAITCPGCFESPEAEITSAMAIIKSTMQNAYLLDVAIDTKVSFGSNWQEL